jgi:hypothetical protein
MFVDIAIAVGVAAIVGAVIMFLLQSSTKKPAVSKKAAPAAVAAKAAAPKAAAPKAAAVAAAPASAPAAPLSPTESKSAKKKAAKAEAAAAATAEADAAKAKAAKKKAAEREQQRKEDEEMERLIAADLKQATSGVRRDKVELITLDSIKAKAAANEARAIKREEKVHVSEDQVLKAKATGFQVVDTAREKQAQRVARLASPVAAEKTEEEDIDAKLRAFFRGGKGAARSGPRPAAGGRGNGAPKPSSVAIPAGSGASHWGTH